MTLRTDFLGQCVRFLELPDAINRAEYLTPRLARDEIERAITGPARHFGGAVEPQLVSELINAVGSDPDQLPVLQHALSQMWEFARSRTGTSDPTIGWTDFKSAGGVKHALSQHADKALAGLSGQAALGDVLTREQQVARHLFLAITEQRLVEGGGQTVRRPQSLTRISEWAGLEVEELCSVVKAFADPTVNFVHYDGDLGSGTVIDISHEALIRQWDRLREWVTEEANRVADYRRLHEKASEYSNSRTGAALLSGVSLARAQEWLNEESTNSGWRPSPRWAKRYAHDEDEAAAEFELCVTTFISAPPRPRAPSEWSASASRKCGTQSRPNATDSPRRRSQSWRVSGAPMPSARHVYKSN